MPLPLLIFASIYDKRTKTIPNWLTFPYMLIGIIFTAVFRSDSITSCVIGMAIIFAFGIFGATGMGDIKLLMAVSSFCGAWIAIWTLGIASALLPLTMLFKDSKKAKQAIANVYSAIFYKGRLVNGESSDNEKYAFAVYIAAGYIITTGGLYLWRIL
jgi:Flp pilus assembly protein protease CpaA